MCRHPQCKDMVLKAELFKLRCVVASMAIKDKQFLFATGILSM